MYTVKPAPEGVKVTKVGASMLKGSMGYHTATVQFSTGHVGIIGIKGKTRADAIKIAKEWIKTNGDIAAWDRVKRRSAR